MSFSQCQNENECFSPRGEYRPHSGRIHKCMAKLLEKFQARFEYLEEMKKRFAFLVNIFQC